MELLTDNNKTESERTQILLQFQNKFNNYLANKLNYNNAKFVYDQILPWFNKIMHLFTSTEIASYLQELFIFTYEISDLFVYEIKRCTNVEKSENAAIAVYNFLKPISENSNGFLLLKSISFILNSCDVKVLESMCKVELPNSLVKIIHLFLNLTFFDNLNETENCQKVHNLLLTSINSLCVYPFVAEELVTKDDLIQLFIGASAVCLPKNVIWRDAHFIILFTIIKKNLTASIIEYIHSKGCFKHFLKNIRNSEIEGYDKVIILCNVIDLLQLSATKTSVLIEDFKNADGFLTIANFCIKEDNLNLNNKIFHSLIGLITAGDETVNFEITLSQFPFYNFKLSQTFSKSLSTVRVFDALSILTDCFNNGSDGLCLEVLENMLTLYKLEKYNYFIIEKYSPFYLFVEKMIKKSTNIQQKVLEILEYILRTLNFIPCKELMVLNTHLTEFISKNNFLSLKQLFSFYFQILPINIAIKDAFRELSILENFLNVVQTFCEDFNNIDESKSCIVQMAMDLLVLTTKGNATNAQFLTENFEIKTIKNILLLSQKVKKHNYNNKDYTNLLKRYEDFKCAALILVKNLLFLAKNEQLFSSLLQLLFLDPNNIILCDIILKLFISVLLESHKVRIMFRRSGGFICLLTLLLHMENSFNSFFIKISDIEMFNQTVKFTFQEKLQHILFIFRVLTVSMRYEPSNAKYFLTEVKPNIINSILRSVGCFSQTTQISVYNTLIWNKISLENCKKKFILCHIMFQNSEKILERNCLQELEDVPIQIFVGFFFLKLLFDLAFDNYEKQSNKINWANENEWLQSSETLETISLFSFSSQTVLVHPNAILCILQLLPSIIAYQNNVDQEFYDNSKNKSNLKNDSQLELELWTASAQFYITLLLKAIMKSERNQQIMCQHEMPKILLEIGSDLFRTEKHPLLSSFYYLFERLACQLMHPRELRKFLRLDQPLCCLNLDEDNNSISDQAISGGPVPIHRVKALVSMLTPRNHSLVHPPAFIEFDLTIEGFACLFVPSISKMPSLSNNGNALNLSYTNERLFPPINGLTFMTWLCVDDFIPIVYENTNSFNQAQYIQNSTICLLTIVKSFNNAKIYQKKIESDINIENYLTCFYVYLNMLDRCLIVSTAEHSIVDELRRDFFRPNESFVCVPLSDQFFHIRQWNHLAIVFSKTLKQNYVDVFLNGKCLLNNKQLFFQTNAYGMQTQLNEHQSFHAIIGTLPFLRKPSNLKWKIASLYLIEESMSIETIKKIISLQPHYTGNLQTKIDGTVLVQEEKLILMLNAKSNSELTCQTLRSIIRRIDCDLVASLLGISSNDNNTPLRILWNTASHVTGNSRALCAVMVGYLGIRTFSPCPVSALLDSIGGVAPLLGLIAMCTDSQGLYASLKVLVSAVQTNISIVNSLIRNRGYQTLAMLLEEKAVFINSHILHLVLSLAGTVDVLKENTIISNLQVFDDLLCDLDVWSNASDDVKKLLFEHFYELIIDDHGDNLTKVRNSSLLNRLLIFVYENKSLLLVQNDIIFRLIGAIVQPPCDSQSLLRLGQTISATIPLDSCRTNSNNNSMQESSYPFHLNDLTNLIIINSQSNSNRDQSKKNIEEIDLKMYAVYARNRLLNIVVTILAHSGKQINNQLCESIVDTLGFEWILSLCLPEINSGTLYLALKILVNTLKYPALMEKFRDGSANSGWLSDADSVIRNRAAVLLGFSVAASGGSVGSHVDVNPELLNCSGFAALEHLMYAHADKSFAYLAVCAILFGQHNANIQIINDFNINSIWSHVFSLSEKSSVASAIEIAQFCPDALISLLSMIRACIHRQKFAIDEDHYSHNFAVIILQLIKFLYQNSEKFFFVCHTETFVVSLFNTLASMQNSIESSTSLKFNEKNESRSVRLILELLSNIILNDMCLSHDGRSEWPFDALVEFMESGGDVNVVYYTDLINACLNRFMSSDMFFANASLMIPQSAQHQISQTSESTALNFLHFLSKVIDSVWNCFYRGNPIQIFKCFLKLLAETHVANKAVAQIACTENHLNALFSIVLYLISRPIDNVDTQMSVLDTLAEIIRNQHLFLSKNVNNALFFGALVHLIFMLSEKPDIDTFCKKNETLERGTAQVAMCAQSVWGMLWQQKKAFLDELFKRNVDLDLYTARASCGEIANQYWLQFVDSQTDCNFNLSSNQTYQLNSSQSFFGSRLTGSTRSNVGQFQSKLSRVAKSSFQRLKNRNTVLNAACNLSSYNFEKVKIESETFYMWICVHISLLKELINNQCLRYHEWHAHVRKWCLKEWHNTEAELTRERGLWGPEKCSILDKHKLDITEGLYRVRKKLLPNPDFYQRYPYRPYLELPESKSIRTKVAVSKDSKLYYERMRRRRFHTMDDRIIENSNFVSLQNNNEQIIEISAEMNMSIIKRMMQKNLITNKIQSVKDEEELTEKVQNIKQNLLNENTEDDEADLLENDTDSTESKKSEFNQNRIKSDAEKKQHISEKELIYNTKSLSPTSISRETTFADKKKLCFSTTNGPDNQTLLRLLEEGEQLQSMFRCARIQGLDTLEGLLLFGKEHYYVVDGFTLLKTKEIRDLDFLPEQFHDPIVPYMAMGNSNRISTKSNRLCSKFCYDDIKDIHKRRYLLQPIALEVFSSDGRNYLLAFPRKIRDRVYQKFVLMAKSFSSNVARTMAEQRKLLPAEASSTGHQLINQLMGQQSMTHKWQQGEISNFNYLMYLNTLAGRSYNDLSQYPVFPWILADYESENLDLTNPKTFRNLSQPMGAQSSERLSKFLKRFREWDDPTGEIPPYMFGTHYSSAMIVLSYLVRLEPFTEQFLKLQGNHFDLADRMFHSVKDAFVSASQNNMADVRELIPEFFYLPEMFINANNFDLSVKQSGIRLHHVQLPKWAYNDPHEFVRLHRQALECDYVSEHLHEWIDLIFGYKQNGDAAREANNVFHHLFYEENVNFDIIDDPLTRNATLGFINNFGQIPSQLFKKPHPQKRIMKNFKKQKHSLISNENCTTSLNFTHLNYVSIIPGVTTPKLFYHCLASLTPSLKPVKELKAAVGDILINKKNQVIVLEQNKIFLPPNSYLAWGFHDRSIRFGVIGSEKSESVLEISDVYEITCMTAVDGKIIFAGLTTGTVLVWLITNSSTANSNFISSSSSLSSSISFSYGNISTRKALDAHTDLITALAACNAHSFIVSASRDQTAVVWHLTQFTFIRQLIGHPAAVSAVAVNDTTGDIATASSSFFFVWTLNGVLLSVVNTSTNLGLFNHLNLVLCLSFSTLNEWDENNVILCGTSDGFVKIYSLYFLKIENNKETLIQLSNFEKEMELLKDNTIKSTDKIKNHILKKQQRIQSQYKRLYMNNNAEMGDMCTQLSTSEINPQKELIKNLDDTSLQKKLKDDKENNNKFINENFKTRRILQLKRVLSEHTAFNQSKNNQPAPITSVKPTLDHKSILVGDGIGRVWLWTINNK